MKIKGFKNTIDWYDKNAEQYSKAIQNLSSPEQIDEFTKLLSKNAKVLDAGCAAGRDSKLLADEGLNVIGIDLSPQLIKIAKEKFSKIEFLKGNFLKLPFPEKSFDGIWAHASLLHFDSLTEVKKALGEFFRVLKPRGIIHVLVKAKTGREKFVVVSDKVSKHKRFFQFFTKDEVQSLLEQTGFEIIKTEQYQETERNPKRRSEVEWILCLARKE